MHDLAGEVLAAVAQPKREPEQPMLVPPGQLAEREFGRCIRPA
ncbi:MAG: hypothetical protein AAFX79_00435 [Planctomycetota bacterium]